MACTAGLAVLDVIEKEGLQQNSKEVGTYFLRSLDQLRHSHDVIGDVRGQVNIFFFLLHTYVVDGNYCIFFFESIGSYDRRGIC